MLNLNQLRFSKRLQTVFMRHKSSQIMRSQIIFNNPHQSQRRWFIISQLNTELFASRDFSRAFY